MKPKAEEALEEAKSPSPHGEGGLKLKFEDTNGAAFSSLPTRGGWIETYFDGSQAIGYAGSLPTRGGWIETG